MSPDLPQTAAQTTPEMPWPVRVLTTKIARYLMRMPVVWVEGQVVELRRRGDSPSAYLTLRDPVVDLSQSVVVARTVLDSMPTPLSDGARVVARLVPEYFDKRGQFLLRAVDIRPVGVGALLAQIEQLRRLLASEGVFDQSRKRPLPFAPSLVGLVCGRDSDAEHDVVVNTGKRWPATSFRVVRVPVQGSGAARAVADAVATLDGDPGVEVIVVARGGGSLEDLLPFSNEALIRAVSACRTPVVSAIGHEADTPLLDLVADARASTPTDTARLLVPDAADHVRQVQAARAALRAAMRQRVRWHQDGLDTLRARLDRVDPGRVLVEGSLQVAEHRGRMERAVRHRMERESVDTAHLIARLRAISPQATLNRGYAIVIGQDGAVVRDAQHTKVGQQLDVMLGQGRLTTEVVEVRP